MRSNPTSGVLSEAWGLYRAHWQHLVVVSAVIHVGVAVLSALFVALLGVAGALISAILAIVAVFWVQGALTRAVQDIRDGRADLSVGETFRSVGDRVAPVAGASVLAGIAIAIGLLLLIVPGLILLTIWSLIVPVIVLERVGALASFGRSQQLVRGNGWNVFGVVVLTFLVLIAFGIVLGIILSPLPDEIQNPISNVLSGTLTTPFVALTWTLVYYRLRDLETPQASAA